MAARRVAVTGAGVVSPLGDSPARLHTALLAGEKGIGPISLFATEGTGCRQGGEIRDFDAALYLGERNLRPLDRTSRLLVVAAQQALAASGWTAERLAAEEVGLVLGTVFCSVRTIAEFDRRGQRLGPSLVSPFDFANSVINAATGQAAIWHGLRGIGSTVAAGEAGGLLALAQAADLIRAGRATALLAGGAEELCFESFLGHARAGRLCGCRPGAPGGTRNGGGENRGASGGSPLAAGTGEPAVDEKAAERAREEVPVPFDARRNGFALAEGAALLMLEDWAAALARGAPILGEVLGQGAAFDPSDRLERTGRIAREGAAWGSGLKKGERGDEAPADDREAAVGGRVEALARAVRLALADAGTSAEELDCLSASANGSVAGDRAEARGLAEGLGDAARNLPVTAIKSMLGEALGASGALQAVALLESLQCGRLPGIAGLGRPEEGLPLKGLSPLARGLAAPPGGRHRRGLLSAVSADGHCCALVLSAAAREILQESTAG